MSIVENNLRNQRDLWKEISSRVSTLESRGFPHGVPKRIILFGLGSSFIAAKLCQLTLKRDRTRPRTPVIACPSSHVGVDAIPAKGDWVFAFTHRGAPGLTLQALELSERMGAFTVQVSAKGVEASRYTHFLLETAPLEEIEPHTIAVSGAICAVSSLLLGTKGIEEWDALTSIPLPDLDQMRELAGTGPQLLLGEWEGEWLAREGALKLMEMARLPVRAFGSEEFFHGPRFSAGADTKVWHISLPKDPREKEITQKYPNHFQIPIYGSSPLAWVPGLVQLQWLALAVAKNLDVDPDLK